MRKGYRLMEIGIDIDNHNKQANEFYQERMRLIGVISFMQKTKHGFHYKIFLKKMVGFKKSIELRYFCGDDPRRMIKDVIKVWNGAKEFDLLFTKKWKGWK